MGFGCRSLRNPIGQTMSTLLLGDTIGWIHGEVTTFIIIVRSGVRQIRLELLTFNLDVAEFESNTRN